MITQQTLPKISKCALKCCLGLLGFASVYCLISYTGVSEVMKFGSLPALRRCKLEFILQFLICVF